MRILGVMFLMGENQPPVHVTFHEGFGDKRSGLRNVSARKAATETALPVSVAILDLSPGNHCPKMIAMIVDQD